MSRSVTVCVTIAGALIAASAAHADTGMLPNGAMIKWQRQFITQNGTLTEPPTPDDLRRYLNLAHCLCSQSMTGDEQTIAYELTLSTTTGTNRPGEFWVGTMCDGDAITRSTNCRKLTTPTIADIDALATSSQRFEFPLFDIIAGKDTSAGCPIREGDATLWLLVDSDGDTNPDYFSTKPLGNGNDVTGIDTQAPELPTAIKAQSAESAISLSWTPPTARPMDVKYYQALCVGADGAPVKKEADRPTQRYQTATDLCGVAQQIALTETTNTPSATDGPADTTALASLDPAFLCGESTGSTSTGMMISGLKNDVPYSVVLLSVDFYGNVTGTKFLNTVTPKPATDFWEDLHGRGSTVQGGFCATSGHGGGDAGSLALIGLALVVLVKKRKLRAAAPLVVLAMMMLPKAAHAQGADPTWEDDPAGAENAAAADDEDLVKWHVGLKLGPYVPDIDKQLGMDPGPYKAMYGGSRVVPMLDIERIFWRGFGQLGAGGTIGYLQKSAHSFQEGTMVGDPKRPRSPGDTNTFRLIPFAATVTYRFTYLDDELSIPVVPYVRGGLAYYTWWVRSNGKTASVCSDGSNDPSCSKNKAYGGTLGVQGAIGLAIRAERIDPAAAASMRAGGVNHAGFYAELSLAKVDGFGSNSRLSVGDTTWFAGVDFEF